MDEGCNGFSSQALVAGFEAALAASLRARAGGDLPYGAAIVSRAGDLILATEDQVTRLGDPTRHAEFDAVRAAVAARGAEVSDLALVSTGEPCGMCFGAAYWAQLGLVAYALTMAELKERIPGSMDDCYGPVETVNALLNCPVPVYRFGVVERQRALAIWDLDNA